LAQLVRRLAESGLRVEPAAADDRDAASTICTLVEQSRFDLVIKTARSEDVPRARVFGSTATRLLQECACPVWIVRERGHAEKPRVVAAVRVARRPSVVTLDRSVVRIGAQLAEIRGAELHVVSAWRMPGESMLARRIGLMELQEFRREYKEESEAKLRSFLDRSEVAVPAERIHLVRGEPADVIAAVTEQLDAELLVVGSAGRTGVRRWLLGNTAEEVLRNAPSGLLGVGTPASPA
jgi:universal stress protein E